MTMMEVVRIDAFGSREVHSDWWDRRGQPMSVSPSKAEIKNNYEDACSGPQAIIRRSNFGRRMTTPQSSANPPSTTISDPSM